MSRLPWLAWQQEIINVLASRVAAPEAITIDDGDVRYPEDYDEPGWHVWLGGTPIRLSWGIIDFECDVSGDVARAADALLAASRAWDGAQ